MMKPICVPCQRFFRPEKTGYYFLEGMPAVDRAEPGVSKPEQWKPYKVWVGDRWICHGCGAMVIYGVGRNPIAEHYEDDFKKRIDELNASQFQVNDC